MPIREIPIALLESKLAKYFNDRETPLFKVRLHGTDFGQSDLTVFFDQEGMGYQEIFSMDMGHLEFNLSLAPDPDFYFNNLETERISTTIFFADRVGIEARISHLKRSFGLRRTRLRRLGGARTWVGLGIFAYNLQRMTVVSS